MKTKTLFLVALYFSLFCALPAPAEQNSDPAPYHFAVVMPADIAESSEDSPQLYDGVKFPLLCGFGSVYPAKNKFIFTKTTDLPVTHIEKTLREIERRGYIAVPGFQGASRLVYAEEPHFFPTLQKMAEQYYWFSVILTDVGNALSLDKVPQFTRACAYDSKKEPPVDCAYHVWDVERLRVPFEWEKPARYSVPEHLAVVIPARVIEFSADPPQDYDGVEFPLFCGFVSIYPEENRFVFTKTTNLPVTDVEKLLREIEKDGFINIRGHFSFRVPVSHREFSSTLTGLMSSKGFTAFYIGSGNEVPLGMAPGFTQTCPYNSQKEPPVDCAYEIGEVENLRIPYDWEIKIRKEMEQERQARQKQ